MQHQSIHLKGVFFWSNNPDHPICVFEHGLVYFVSDGYPVEIILDCGKS